METHNHNRLQKPTIEKYVLATLAHNMLLTLHCLLYYNSYLTQMLHWLDFLVYTALAQMLHWLRLCYYFFYGCYQQVTALLHDTVCIQLKFQNTGRRTDGSYF